MMASVVLASSAMRRGQDKQFGLACADSRHRRRFLTFIFTSNFPLLLVIEQSDSASFETLSYLFTQILISRWMENTSRRGQDKQFKVGSVPSRHPFFWLLNTDYHRASWSDLENLGRFETLIERLSSFLPSDNVWEEWWLWDLDYNLTRKNISCGVLI